MKLLNHIKLFGVLWNKVDLRRVWAGALSLPVNVFNDFKNFVWAVFFSRGCWILFWAGAFLYFLNNFEGGRGFFDRWDALRRAGKGWSRYQKSKSQGESRKTDLGWREKSQGFEKKDKSIKWNLLSLGYNTWLLRQIRSRIQSPFQEQAWGKI